MLQGEPLTIEWAPPRVVQQCSSDPQTQDMRSTDSDWDLTPLTFHESDPVFHFSLLRETVLIPGWSSHEEESQNHPFWELKNLPRSSSQSSAEPQGNLSVLLVWKPLPRSVRIPPGDLSCFQQEGGGNQETWSTLCPRLPPPASVFEVPRCGLQDFLKMWEKVVMSPLKVPWEGKGRTQTPVEGDDDSRTPNQEDVLLLLYFLLPMPHSLLPQQYHQKSTLELKVTYQITSFSLQMRKQVPDVRQ